MIVGGRICWAFSLIICLSTRIEVPILLSFIVDNLFEHGDGALCRLLKWHFKFVLFGGRLCIQSPLLHQISLHCCYPFHPSAFGYGHYWLWMDSASAHYANNILAPLQQPSIYLVPKDAD